MFFMKSLVKKTDTIIIKSDTIFRDNTVNIDTTLSDKWYKLNVKLKYPSTVIVNPTFTSEKYVITSLKKEYVNTPSKWWIIRLF